MHYADGGFQRHRASAVRVLFRGLLAFCSLVFFASSLAFSMAPAHPYLKGHSRGYHCSRLDRSSEAGVEGAGEIPSPDRPPVLLVSVTESPRSVGLLSPSPKVPRLLRFYYFRPPPLF